MANLLLELREHDFSQGLKAALAAACGLNAPGTWGMIAPC
jgi:hypothetical protein